MNYQSVSDLASVIQNSLSEVPKDVDLVVGVPRSGVLAASMIALQLNAKYCDLSCLLEDRLLENGQTRHSRFGGIIRPSDSMHTLIIDDSISSGRSMEVVRQAVASAKLKSRISFGAVYSTKRSRVLVDLSFVTLEPPRYFEWNVMHRSHLSTCCVDIDGVLCHDPSASQNDDGPEYRDFILNAKPLAIPSYPIGHLVTSRLEKYRSETEDWLRKNGVLYRQLHMLDLPTAEERRRQNVHGAFKSEIYTQLKDSHLFIESEAAQAVAIANSSGKPVLCFGNQKLYRPGVSIPSVRHSGRRFLRRAMGKLGKFKAWA